jgi:hypothetical protein
MPTLEQIPDDMLLIIKHAASVSNRPDREWPELCLVASDWFEENEFENLAKMFREWSEGLDSQAFLPGEDHRSLLEVDAACRLRQASG